MRTTGQIMQYVEAYPGMTMAVDDTGLGGGVSDRLEEMGIEHLAVNFGGRAFEYDRFKNKVSELWWRGREAFDPKEPDPIALPVHHPLLRKLMAQLSGARYRFDSLGKIWVEKVPKDSKDSPDLGDAFMLALEAWVVYHMTNITGGRKIYSPAMQGY